MSHTVTAIIVNYNAGPLLRGCVDSLLACPLGIEIIVVDNASHDGSQDGLPLSPHIRLIRNPANVGFAAACNIGVQAASAPFLLFLNPDCYFQPGAVATLLASLQSGERVGMVGGLLVNADGSEQGGGRRAVPTPWRSFVRAFGLHRFADRWPKLFYDFHLHKQPLPDGPIEVEAISGACMLVRREAVEDVGLWDERYFLHCEDLDWCMRFRQKDWKILFVPDARINHALGACSESRRMFVEWHKHKGMVRFYRKFFRHQYPGVLMGLVAVGVWLRFALVALNITVRRVFAKLGDGRVAELDPLRPAYLPEGEGLRPEGVGVLGATSFVGMALLRLLAHAGWRVTAFSRAAVENGAGVEWRKLSPSPQPSDKTTSHSTRLPKNASQVTGYPARGEEAIPHWICVAPIWVLPEHFSLFEASGARRVVVLSSTSRFSKHDSSDVEEQALSRRFAEAEARLQAWAEARGVEWVVLRPTLIYGGGKDKNISEIARLIRRFGFFPLLGVAKGLRQPIHAADVAGASLSALQVPCAANRAYNISGGETLSYRDMVGRVFSTLGRRPRLLTVPLWAFRLAVALLRCVPRYRQWSPAMAERMNQDLVFDHSDAERDLNFKPRAFVLRQEDLPTII